MSILFSSRAMADYSAQQATEKILNEVAKATENEMLSQLNELVSRGLIVWEQGPQVLTRDKLTDNLSISFSGRLVLKDQEYIETLEKKVSELLRVIETLGTKK
jgi:hypothetical protein